MHVEFHKIFILCIFEILKVSLVPISMFIWQTNSGGSHGWILDVIYNKEMIKPRVNSEKKNILEFTLIKPKKVSRQQKYDHLKDMVENNKILVTSLIDDIPSTILHSSRGSEDEIGPGLSEDEPCRTPRTPDFSYISHPSLRWQFKKVKEYCGSSIWKIKKCIRTELF